MPRPDDDAAIRELIATFVAGWNAGDGDTCARPFAQDADFTAITGLRAHGRELIAAGHREILSTIYRGTEITATVNTISFLRPDVASADITVRFVGKEPFGLKQTSLGVIATRDADVWQIAVFRNMVPFGRPAAGPLEQHHTPPPSNP